MPDIFCHNHVLFSVSRETSVFQAVIHLMHNCVHNSSQTSILTTFFGFHFINFLPFFTHLQSFVRISAEQFIFMEKFGKRDKFFCDICNCVMFIVLQFRQGFNINFCSCTLKSALIIEHQQQCLVKKHLTIQLFWFVIVNLLYPLKVQVFLRMCLQFIS